MLPSAGTNASDSVNTGKKPAGGADPSMELRSGMWTTTVRRNGRDTHTAATQFLVLVLASSEAADYDGCSTKRETTGEGAPGDHCTVGARNGNDRTNGGSDEPDDLESLSGWSEVAATSYTLSLLFPPPVTIRPSGSAVKRTRRKRHARRTTPALGGRPSGWTEPE